MKRVFITGWAGFVGRHLTTYFNEMGWEVAGCDLEDFYQTDMLEVMTNKFRADSFTRYDLVIHCAFNVGGRAEIDGVNTHVAKNLELDGRFFDWVVRTKQPRVIYYSSSAAYPVYLQKWRGASKLSEHHIDLLAPDLPDAAYGWAKLTAETVLVPMARAHGVNVQVLRPFSGYGFDQHINYPFPAIMFRASAHENGKNFEVWGPERQARDWIHIDDVVAASYIIGTEGDNETVNLCTGVKTEFGTLAQMFLDKFGKDGRITFNTSQPTGVLVRVGNPAHMLNWYTPKISIDEGVSRAVRRSRGIE